MMPGWLRPLALLPAIALCPLRAADYQHQIRPILATHCVGCHHAGDIAPMPLTTYSEVRPWARAMRQAVLLHKMPPWDAAPNPSHPFRNTRALSQPEIDAIVAWAGAGAPQEEASEKPANADAVAEPASTTAATSNAVTLGQPDYTLTIPGFVVPASGSLPYSFLILPLHLDHDIWVRAADFHIDQPQAIHHINAFVRPPSSSFLAGSDKEKIFTPSLAERAARRADEKVFDRRELLLGYEPGYRPGPWFPDSAKLIRAGSDIVFELHYNPNGKPVVDHSQLRLYLAPSPPRYRVLAIDTLRDLDLDIPPAEAHYVSHATMTLAQPARLLSVQPHMHYRGHAMRVEASYPESTQPDVLLDVPRYDFNWQTTYSYRDPITLPAGTRLDSEAVFDNSPANPSNPNPAVSVHWGDQTTDEMHIAFLELILDRDQDPERIFVTRPQGLKVTQLRH